MTALLAKHYHQQTKHQGRHFTRGRIRTAGYWIIGEKRLVNKAGKARTPKNGGSAKRAPYLTPAPPFTYVGLDVFGPWQVVARRTRGGHAMNKRWA